MQMLFACGQAPAAIQLPVLLLLCTSNAAGILLKSTASILRSRPETEQ